MGPKENPSVSAASSLFFTWNHLPFLLFPTQAQAIFGKRCRYKALTLLSRDSSHFFFLLLLGDHATESTRQSGTQSHLSLLYLYFSAWLYSWIEVSFLQTVFFCPHWSWVIVEVHSIRIYPNWHSLLQKSFSQLLASTYSRWNFNFWSQIWLISLKMEFWDEYISSHIDFCVIK